MQITYALNIILVVVLIFFVILLASGVVVFIQLLFQVKKILIEFEDIIESFKTNQEEIKIKILDFVEYVLKRLRKILTGRIYLSKGIEPKSLNEKKE